MKRLPVLLLAVGFWILSGCLPVQQPGSLPTETSLPSATPEPFPSPTVVWFPPTATFTPFPTRGVTPTPEVELNLGELILQDTFEKEDNQWSLATTSLGTIALGKNELTIVIPEERGILNSVRDGLTVDDFYLEISAGPTLCRGQDEYGVLYRYQSNSDFYRFSLSCDGQVRLDRLASGNASSPQPWTMSGAFPPGAPSMSRIGIWVYDQEMRFYINDIHQFTVNDPIIPRGSIGVFARSTGSHALTVSFSNLSLYRIEP